MLRVAMEVAGLGRLGLPPGIVTALEPLPARQALRVRAGTGATAVEREVEAPHMAAILIAYCLGARIPLPRVAAKTVAVVEDGLLLEFLTTLTNPPRYQRPR